VVDHILRASLERNMPITIIYMNEGGTTQRDIKVIQLSDDYVRGYCYLRKEIRTFMRSSILSAFWSKLEKQYRGARLVEK